MAQCAIHPCESFSFCCEQPGAPPLQRTASATDSLPARSLRFARAATTSRPLLAARSLARSLALSARFRLRTLAGVAVPPLLLCALHCIATAARSTIWIALQYCNGLFAFSLLNRRGVEKIIEIFARLEISLSLLLS